MATDIKNMKDTEIEKAIIEARAQLQSLRFGVAGSKNRNVHEARNLRRKVARLLTEQNARG